MGVLEVETEIPFPPRRSRRTSRRISNFAFHNPSKHGRAGTLKFDELDINKALPVPEKAIYLSRRSSFNSLIQTKQEPKFSNLALCWTTFIVTVPILGFTVAVLGFVLKYRLPKTPPHPFLVESDGRKDGLIILIDFSATRLAFIASWSSTLAPMLLGSLMALWHIPTACNLAFLTRVGDVQQLPTPHQLSMLVGLSAGSLDELRKYFLYRINKVKAEQPVLLSRSACVLSMSAVLAALIFCADTAIHTFTSTVSYNRNTIREEPLLSFGRGISPECIDFDRSLNQGLPCTVVADATVGANFIARDSGEIISLGRNVSISNTIWKVTADDLQQGDLMVLMPQATNASVGVEYSASTVGVSTQCIPSTKQCQVRMSEDTSPEDSYVVFNCTENFRGVLGASPDVAKDSVVWTQTDSTTPDFNVKLDRNFQYAYFSDSEMAQIYNSIGGSPTNSGSSGDLALPDSKLINPIHLATAGLIPVQNGAAGESLSADADVFSLGGSLIAYSLNCTVTSYDVIYTWVNGSINSFTYTPTSNGSMIELAHGMQAEGMPSLSQSQSLASLSDSANGMARSFSNSHSVDALTLIASVMSPRKNTVEATTESLLVTEMSALAFSFLIVSNLLYIIFGVVLAIRAWMANSRDSRDMVARLSVEGLSAMALEDTIEKRVRRVDDTKDMFEESRIGVASRKVGLKAYPGGGHVMTVEQPRL
ncbi:hypothetical protein LTR84_011829 [Exophiala bonariae]|uniref:Uncharacterized protein n=1 Tax=Exophiala bonariae TaxID=1690606 RepID=A0AAV9NJL0_9EURO|nr:hypothetical protein LTR84_011829 [Exophiala bonariae]